MLDFICRICKGKHYKELVSWEIPLAADVTEKKENCKMYPIEPVICSDCGHVQLRETLDINMYDNYLYTPSYAGEFQQYVEKFANNVVEMIDDKANLNVVEIGSSNGFMLKCMKKKGCNVVGFEPSGILASEARKMGVNTVEEYFNAGSDTKVKEILGGNADVVIARHVLEHLDDPLGVIRAMASIAQEGMIIIEVPWLLKIVKENQFYAFFHEHVSYFSVTILQKLIENVGFEIINVSENNLEGGSITIYAKKKNNKIKASNIDVYLEKERKYLSTEAILKFAQKSMHTIQNVHKYVDEQRKKGKKIAVWGAGQRGCTLLALCKLTDAEIEYAIDVNENYHWKYIQGTNIQIVPPEYLKDHFVDQILILATGYSESIINDNLDYVYRGGEFVNIIEKEFV